MTDAEILANADPDDLDGDGISGRPNWIDLPSFVVPRENAVMQGGKYLGRFGKRAIAYSIFEQIVKAYKEDIGINTSYDPIDTYTGQPVTEEVDNQQVLDLEFYMRTLRAPIPRADLDKEHLRGQQLFRDLKCASCHIPKMTTGDSPIKALAFKEFSAYTDLLLHDMGTGLDDGYAEGESKTYEWRTPALWGLGLAPDSQGGSYHLLHDGRAGSIDEAILFHGGEAAESRTNYRNLLQADKDAIIKFLESL